MQYDTKYLYESPMAAACAGRYRSRSKTSVAAPWTSWSGEPEEVDTCSPSADPLAAHLYDSCFEVDAKDMFETAVPLAGQCVAQGRLRRGPSAILPLPSSFIRRIPTVTGNISGE